MLPRLGFNGALCAKLVLNVPHLLNVLEGKVGGSILVPCLFTFLGTVAMSFHRGAIIL